MALKQKKFFDAPVYFSKHAWDEKCQLINREITRLSLKIDEHKRQQIELNGQLVDFQWAVGDSLLEAEESGVIKARALKSEAKRWFPRYTWGTLKNIKSVCHAIEPSRRRDALSYSHHVEVAKVQDAALQDDIMDWAEGKKVCIGDLYIEAKETSDPAFRYSGATKFPLSVRDVKKHIATKKGPDKAAVVLKIRVKKETESFLSDIAHAKKLRNAAGALWWMAWKYAEQNEEQLKAEVDADKAARAAEQKRIAEESEARRKQNEEQLRKHDEELLADVDDKIPSY